MTREGTAEMRTRGRRRRRGPGIDFEFLAQEVIREVGTANWAVDGRLGALHEASAAIRVIAGCRHHIALSLGRRLRKADRTDWVLIVCLLARA
eukprot:SAG11_NODE_13035_length_673_cov_1.069686_1_plen_92_part_01